MSQDGLHTHFLTIVTVLALKTESIWGVRNGGEGGRGEGNGEGKGVAWTFPRYLYLEDLIGGGKFCVSVT